LWRDQFRPGVRLRHSSKEVILSWCPPVAAGFDHVALHFPFTFNWSPPVAAGFDDPGTVFDLYLGADVAHAECIQACKRITTAPAERDCCFILVLHTWN
jgi:hypothetical protein